MGALAPAAMVPWIPEDDVLLRKAVEAGASLESLAKGAVQFSRKFTIGEIQQRWHSLLYDPVVSADAALRMIEFGHSSPTSLSRPCTGATATGRNCFSGKRKAHSVRNSYYAMRKRICSDPFNCIDLSFLLAPDDSSYPGNEDGLFTGQCMLEDPVSNHFEIGESTMDILHQGFSQVGDENTAHVFRAHYNDTVQGHSTGQGNQNQELHNMLTENLPGTRIGGLVEEVQTKELPVNCDQVNGCPSFIGNQGLSSAILEHNAQFDDLGYSTPLPEMPMWSAPASQTDLGLRETDLHVGDPFSVLCNGDNMNTYSSGVLGNTDSILKLERPIEDVKNVTDCALMAELSELSNSLLDFTNDEEFPFLEEGKDAIDKYDFEALLLSSPTDVILEGTQNIVEPESSVKPYYLPSQCDAWAGNIDEYQVSCNANEAGCPSEIQVTASLLTVDQQFPELIDGVICCALNTEDPEIPCNDNIIFPERPKPLVAKRSGQDRGKSNPSTFQGSLRNQHAVAGSRQIDRENSGKLLSSNHMVMSKVPSEASLHPPGNHGAKSLHQVSNSISRSMSTPFGCSTQFMSGKAGTDTSLPAKHREEDKETTFNCCSGKAAKPLVGTAGTASNFHGCYDTNHVIENRLESSQRAELAGAASDQAMSHLPSESEEPVIESDGDAPCFSDIEAMILDMDLDPDDHDFFSREEVLRYQHEDAKKVIMRLEQCAYSCMQRAIASHGAFAILYGRHSKHYIKKPEVLLGRATEDVVIDIDLGNEGPANRISRRQAIINLDKSGSFHIKNLGKRAIYVNDKQITPGETSRLTSRCLIEIRGAAFVFETNQRQVQRYLDSIAGQDHVTGAPRSNHQ